MKKTILSLFTLGVVATLAFVSTQAFFNDTETSTGNLLQAGALDLKIDNTSYAIDYNIPGFQNPTGAFVANTANTWSLNDLTVEKFLNFTDLKPGDYGEDTISVHTDNDSWLCAAARLTDDSDQDCTEPEMANDPTCTNPGLGQGELDERVHFAFWVDDGDNIYESAPGAGAGETIFLQGPVSSLGTEGKIALADNNGGVFGAGNPIPGGNTSYIGKAWCYGAMTSSNVNQDGVNTNTPLTRGTGFNCDGSAENNSAQTDKVVADLQFYAVQSRNNTTFTCAADFTPTWPVQASAPVVDGIITEGEYDGGLSMLITDAGGGTVKAKTNGGFLYIGADIITDTTDNRVCCGFNDEFGVNLGESPTTDTVFLGLGSTNANGRIFGPTDGLFSNFNPVGHTIMSLFGTGHRVLEWKIPLSVLPTIVVGDTLSIGGATESTDGNSAVYPIGLVWGNNATYGQLLVTP